jgi:hypothetical protein
VAYEHLSRDFRHYNSFFAGTAEALMAGMEENARQNPDKQLTVLLEAIVWRVHSHVRQELCISSALKATVSPNWRNEM